MIDAERFWKHVMLEDDSKDACWIWTGAQRDDGIGRFRVGRGEAARAHRVAYEIRNGPLPPNVRLRQTCAHPNCVRHWEPDRPYRKLTQQEIAAIRRSRVPGACLARLHRVTRQRISQIRPGVY